MASIAVQNSLDFDADNSYLENPRSLEGLLSGSLADDRAQDDAAHDEELETVSLNDEDVVELEVLTADDRRRIARRLLALPTEARVDTTSRVVSGRVSWATALRQAESLERLRSRGPSRTRRSGEEISEIARRLLDLPPNWRSWVVCQVNLGQMTFLEATAFAEEPAFFDRLTPARQVIFNKVNGIYHVVLDITRHFNSQLDQLRTLFVRLIKSVWEEGSMNAQLAQYLLPMMVELDHADQHQWYRTVEWLGSRVSIASGGRLHAARAAAVLIVRVTAVRDRSEKLRGDTFAWLDAVGDREVEDEGLCWNGDFWYIHHLFGGTLDEIIDVRPLSFGDAGRLHLLDVQRLMDG
ncbi:hypothetical protein LTR08_003677 [Meristemomyces frigidus]|nr:hypothetical protein LTR08_003677 [Meristemomyces frigidus]